MKKMIVVLGLIVAMMSVNAFGVGFIGTPTAELDQGQWNVGFNYTYMSMDLAKSKLSASKDGDTGSFKIEINDNNIQRYYGAIGYGVTDAWEAYVQLGIADDKARTKDTITEDDDDEPDNNWEGHNFDNDFAWGWGTRYTFYEQDNIRWGASLQMNWLDSSVDHKDGDEKWQIDYSTYDLLIAVGPTADMGGWNLYGGPFFYMLDGDLDGKGTEIDGEVTHNYKLSADLEEDGNFGGFVGAQCMVMDKYCLTTELGFSGGGWAIGAGLSVPF